MADSPKKPKLTAKQERFAQLVASGKTQADAYRLAYDANGSNDATIHDDAYHLTQHPVVSPRIAELAERYAAVAEIDASYVLQRVKATSEDAEREQEHSPALKGYELLGRHVGLFAEHTTSEVHVTHELTGFSADEKRALIAELEGQRTALQASAEVIEGEAQTPELT